MQKQKKNNNFDFGFVVLKENSDTCSGLFMEENRVSEKVRTIEITPDGKTIVRMIPDDRDANNNSAGGRLPGFLKSAQTKSNPNANEDREGNTAQDTKDTVSKNQGESTNKETKSEQNE